MSPKRPRPLSPDDRVLWDAVRKTVKPLSRSSLSAPSGPAKPRNAPPPSQPHPAQPAHKTLPGVGVTARATPAVSFDLAPATDERVAGAALNMDRKAYQRLKRGKTTPEARLDLHGMTQAQAHPALTRFLIDAHNRGLRTVLVITGKGRSGGPEHGPYAERPGILKHQLPHWISSGVLNQIVQQVVEAHQKHGGGGAFYIHLRRKR